MRRRPDLTEQKFVKLKGEFAELNSGLFYLVEKQSDRAEVALVLHNASEVCRRLDHALWSVLQQSAN